MECRCRVDVEGFTVSLILGDVIVFFLIDFSFRFSLIML